MKQTFCKAYHHSYIADGPSQPDSLSSHSQGWQSLESVPPTGVEHQLLVDHTKPAHGVQKIYLLRAQTACPFHYGPGSQ